MTTDLHHALLRASNAERDDALARLREHWLAGRLELDEYEQRCDEAAGGRYVDDLRHALRELPPPPVTVAVPAPAPPAAADGEPRAIIALVLGALALVGAVFTYGMLFIVTLPMSTLAWSLGRRSRRAGGGTVAAVGEALGIAATIVGCLGLSACALFIGVV